MSIPSYYLNSVLELSPDLLISQGKHFVLIDLDNTLLPRDSDTIPPEILSWAQSLQAAGIRSCLLSNNWQKRVAAAADELGFALVAKAVKPLPPAYLLALKRIGAKRRETVMIGDQFFTDVLGAALLGISSVLVRPLAEHDLPHTLLLRRLERLILAGRRPQALSLAPASRELPRQSPQA
jgi:HAD superfamily phosphatase (TIGR01668 family)